MSNLRKERRHLMLQYLMDKVDYRLTTYSDASALTQATDVYAMLTTMSDTDLEKMYIKSKGEANDTYRIQISE